MEVPVINKSNHPLPTYETQQSAGMDLRAKLKAPATIKPFERTLIPTGLYVEIPEGYEGQVRPRSGFAAKYGVTVLNSPGTIDPDYRGEVKVLLINLSHEPVEIQDGDRIAQLLVSPTSRIEWQPVEKLTPTERAQGGYGHTDQQSSTA
jgi:dUTP pyrophosphatase